MESSEWLFPYSLFALRPLPLFNDLIRTAASPASMTQTSNTNGPKL